MRRHIISFLLRPSGLLLAGALTVFLVSAGLSRFVEHDLRHQNRLINVSARGQVTPGADSLLTGFVVSDQPQTLVVRGLGPSLARAGGPAPLSRVLLRVIDNETGRDVGRNEAWRAPGNERLAHDLKHLAPPHLQDAACVLTLPPGGYCALIEAREGQRGIAAIEIFVVKP